MQGNAAQEVNRTVTVVDTTVPVISLIGDEYLTREAGEEYIDGNATWTDIVDGSGVIVAEGQVDTTMPGNYVLSYNYTDQAGNVATAIMRTVTVLDTTAPTIVLNGESQIVLEAGNVYVDAGASWTDLVDGEGTANLSGDVNSNLPGTYTLTYNFTDPAGNSAQEVSRTVTVLDTTVPVISLVGDNYLTHEAGEEYIDLNATWTDIVDGKGVILAEGQVDTTMPGTYVLSYNYTDQAGNVATTIMRTVTVLDTTAPTILLNGESQVVLEAGNDYIDAGASWTDLVDGEGTPNLSGDVNSNLPGTYTLTYQITDAARNAAQEVTRTVMVVDTTVPFITLIGDHYLTHEAGEEYIDSNATWTDIVDGSGMVPAEGQVDIATPGTYVLSYNYTDQAGNLAPTMMRTVTVVDTTAPVITLMGDSQVSLEAGNDYIDLGANWTDLVDGEGTANLSGDVNSNLPGTYTLTYNFTDAAGNVAEVTRMVTVVDTTVPFITLIGDDYLTHEAGEEYIDSNATWTDIVDGSGMVLAEGQVDIAMPGTYVLSYNYTDQAGNVATTMMRTVMVVDTTAPEITLVGDSQVTLEEGNVYIDAGAFWTDMMDGEGTANLSGSVNSNLPGTYTLTYIILPTLRGTKRFPPSVLLKCWIQRLR